MNQGDQCGYFGKNNVGIGQIPEPDDLLNFFCDRWFAWFYNPITTFKRLSLSG